VEIYDGASPSAAGALFDPDGHSYALAGPPARFQSAVALDLAGHRWTAVFRSTGQFEPRLGPDRPRIVAVAGLLATLLLTLLTLAIATSRARVQAALDRSESLARAIMRNFPNGLVGLYDRDLRFLVTDGSHTISVAHGQDLVGRPLSEVTTEATRPALEAAFRSALEGRPARVETDLQGQVLEVTTHPVKGSDGRVSMGVVMTQDVTDRKRAEEQVKASAAYARTLIESILDPLVAIRPDGRIGDVNAAFEAATGLPRDRLVGADFADHFTEPERARTGHQRALADGTLRDYPLTIRHAQGRATDVLCNATVFANPDLTLGGVLVSARDVTEIRALQAQLAIQSRLAALGTLVGGVAHEVNNPLAATLADLDMALPEVREIRDRLDKGTGPVDREAKVRLLDEVIQDLTDAQEGARRIERIVRELKVFAAPRMEQSEIRLADVVAKAVRWLPTSVHQAATISTEVRGAPPVMGSFGQLEQVVVNLVTNAAKATRPGQPNEVAVRVGPGPHGTARLEVSDQGTGIAPEVLPRIFDPFFTTRDVGQGMGLGLTVCHSIVAAHGGTLMVESRVGVGSTFRVELPGLAAGAPRAEDRPRPA
jgi:PAS domain S-box-containing protein